LQRARSRAYVLAVEASALERVLVRDRLVISIALAALTVLSWAYLVLPGEVRIGGERLMPCCGVNFGVTLAMWIVMMIGMMLPSVAPMVLTHAAVTRRRVAHGAPFVPSGLFLLGYLLSWGGFSLAAALVQWLLYRAAFLDRHSLAVGPWAGSAVLIGAAVFQLSPAKDACLSHCRVPLGYFMTEWREGNIGAVSMGLRHGAFCIGCCWLLMAVLFAVGVMNMLWVGVLTAFVLAEKILPWPRVVVWSGSAVCVVGAVALIGSTVLAK
jgi:predicted metal-binding membrane protein